MISIEYANAYTEVLEILKFIPKEDYEKIPKEKIKLFETNSNKNYNFKYNPILTLDEQETSKLAKTIIAILFRDYWATESQRKKILAKEKYDMQKQEEELNKKYKYDDIFKKHEIEKGDILDHNSINQIAMVEYKKENFFSKIINIIKRSFNKNKYIN